MYFVEYKGVFYQDVIEKIWNRIGRSECPMIFSGAKI